MTSVTRLEGKYDIKLGALVTVVNAIKASKQMDAFGEFFTNQIEVCDYSDFIAHSKATPEQLEFCHSKIRELNPEAALYYSLG